MIKIPDYKAGIEGNYWSLVKRHNDGNNGTNTNKGGEDATTAKESRTPTTAEV